MAGVARKPVRPPPPQRVVCPPSGVAQTEQAFQAQVKALARACGWLVFHAPAGNRAEAGFPDLVLVREPRVVFAELKSPKGVVKPAQQEWLSQLEASRGVEARLWRPADWDAIVGTLA